jgi:hypothetical protein
MLLCDISAVTNWIQAVAAVALVLLTLLTLLVLIRYAADTKRIAEASVSQTENSLMPCLVVINRRGEGWAIENQGNGPALNIRFTGYDFGNEPVMKTIPPLGVNAFRMAHNDIAEVFARWPRDFKVEYESLSGKKYATAINMEGVMQAQFIKPPSVSKDATIGEFLRGLKQFMRSRR